MKPVLIVFGIFLVTGALLAGGWSCQFNKPGDYEKSLFEQSKILPELSDRGLAALKASIQLADVRVEHRDHGRLIAGVCAVFSLLAFTLAAVWPKSPRTPSNSTSA